MLKRFSRRRSVVVCIPTLERWERGKISHLKSIAYKKLDSRMSTNDELKFLLFRKFPTSFQKQQGLLDERSVIFGTGMV